MAHSRLKTAALTLAATLVTVLVIAAVVIYSGVIDIAATKPHYALTRWLLETTMEHSVERRARQVAVPKSYRPTGETRHEYGKMCKLCHGGPEKEPSEIGQGLRPRPPDLAKVARGMEPAEIFWIVRNGIRMTGMPAFGVTHSDEKLWEMVAFVKQLPEMPPAKYQRGPGA